MIGSSWRKTRFDLQEKQRKRVGAWWRKRPRRFPVSRAKGSRDIMLHQLSSTELEILLDVVVYQAFLKVME